jgi:hypothetical protein
MDSRTAAREFLASRRAMLTPQQAGVPLHGGRRRVPGLRREEVALLAGVSTDYYTRLEKGNLAGVSESVLDAVARALQLDDVERAHLFQLARLANTPRPRAPQRRTSPRVRASVQRILDTMTGTAAFVRNGRLDVLYTNRLGHALYSPVHDRAVPPVNLARFVFLDPRAVEFYGDWDGIAAAAVGSLRAEAGRDPYDRALADLVGELSLGSEQFRMRWSAPDVDYYRSGTQPFHHPLVGDLTLNYDTLELPADPGQTIVAYTAEPGTADQQALDLLATWPAAEHAVDRLDTSGTGKRTTSYRGSAANR